MSPVLFALALKAFLDYLCKQLPRGDIARAFADAMALAVHPLGTIKTLASCFDTDIRNYSHAAGTGRYTKQWLGWYGYQITLWKILDFHVGTKATAEMNFNRLCEMHRKSVH